MYKRHGLLYAHFSAKASYGWGAEIRKAEYARVQQYAFSNLDHFVTSSLITRMTTDVNVLQNMIISGFRPITRGPSLLIMGIGLSFYMNPKLAFVFVVCTPILAIILFLIVRKVAPMYTRLQSIMAVSYTHLALLYGRKPKHLWSGNVGTNISIS